MRTLLIALLFMISALSSCTPVNKPEGQAVLQSIQIDNSDSFLEKEHTLFKQYDATDFGSNYAMGAFYYNKAIQQIKNIDSTRYQALLNNPHKLEFPITSFFSELKLTNFEVQTYTLFERSRSYLERAYKIGPRSPQLLVALQGCYFAQQMTENQHAIALELETNFKNFRFDEEEFN